MKAFNDIPAFILAGGKSTRMGKDKALLDLNGKPLIAWVAGTLDKLFTNITVIAEQKEPYSFLGLPVQADIIKESGPLGGIHAALVRSSSKHIFVTSCDLPLVTASLIERIVDKRMDADVVMPVEKEITQPLCAVYSRAAFQHVIKHLRDHQLSVDKCLKDMKTATVSAHRNPAKDGVSILANIATPEEYDRIHALKD
jgi:molybdenum cofactor guanylyltransferase